jgi:hypothetical protein
MTRPNCRICGGVSLELDALRMHRATAQSGGRAGESGGQGRRLRLVLEPAAPAHSSPSVGGWCRVDLRLVSYIPHGVVSRSVCVPVSRGASGALPCLVYHNPPRPTCCTRPLALSMGMANPTPLLLPLPESMAVLIPTSSPRLLRSGPPELPAGRGAGTAGRQRGVGAGGAAGPPRGRAASSGLGRAAAGAPRGRARAGDAVTPGDAGARGSPLLTGSQRHFPPILSGWTPSMLTRVHSGVRLDDISDRHPRWRGGKFAPQA